MRWVARAIQIEPARRRNFGLQIDGLCLCRLPQLSIGRKPLKPLSGFLVCYITCCRAQQWLNIRRNVHASFDMLSVCLNALRRHKMPLKRKARTIVISSDSESDEPIATRPVAHVPSIPSISAGAKPLHLSAATAAPTEEAVRPVRPTSLQQLLRGISNAPSTSQHNSTAANASVPKQHALRPPTGDAGSALWVEKHAPATEDALAVHKKKVGEVKAWLQHAAATAAAASGGQRRGQLLVLTGAR